jgi:hypothetical protein
VIYEGHPESKDRLRTVHAQVNEFHHFKVNGLSSLLVTNQVNDVLKLWFCDFFVVFKRE